MSPAARPIRHALCIVPPYQANGGPPAGPAALLAYLRAAGLDGVDFLDLRLTVPDAYAPTHAPVGAFGETFVTDVPDLPLVLRVLRAHDERKPGPLIGELDELFTRYCVERGINPTYLHRYLIGVDRFLDQAFARLPALKLVGFSTWTSNFLTTLIAASHLKRRPSPPLVVAGGPQVTQSNCSARLALESGLVDHVVLGEGEETFVDLYRAFLEGGRPGAIPGTATLDGETGKITRTDRKLLRMSALPTPDFSAMPLGLYGFPRKLPLQMSRGCTDKCTFCSEWSFWRHYRPDSVERVVAQVEELVRRYGMQHLEFTDSLLNAHQGKLRAFAESLLDRGISLRWGGLMRAQMDAETAKVLRRAGLSIAFVGIESMSDETLAAMNKRRTEADNVRALEALLDAGIFVRAGLIPGFPGDSRARFIKTIEVIARLQRRYPKLLELNVDAFVVNPGSPLFDDLGAHGLVGERWAPEYLAIAPRYLAATSEVLCSVSGPNQGLDRLGALQIVRTLTDTPDRVRFGHSLFDAEETLTEDVVTFGRIAPGWFLGRTKGLDARIRGMLFTDAEREQHTRISAEVASGHRDQSALRRLLSAVDRRHLLGAARRSDRVERAVYCEDFARATSLWLPAQVIAREEGDTGLRLVNVSNAATLVVPRAARRWVVELASRPRSRATMDALAQELGFDADEWRAQTALMAEVGILQIVSAAPERSSAPARHDETSARRLPLLRST